MSKYKGIDEREVKCCDKNENTIEAGISFDILYNGTNILRFHYLDHIENMHDISILTQRTKSMHLNKENTKQLIEMLSSLKF